MHYYRGGWRSRNTLELASVAEFRSEFRFRNRTGIQRALFPCILGVDDKGKLEANAVKSTEALSWCDFWTGELCSKDLFHKTVLKSASSLFFNITELWMNGKAN